MARFFHLGYREEWPLWSVEKRIYEALGQVWVELDDVPDPRTKEDGLMRLLDELRRLEGMLMRDGIFGWIVSAEHGNAAIQRAVMLAGARPYAEDATYTYYRKFAGAPAIPRSVLACYRQGRARVWN